MKLIKKYKNPSGPLKWPGLRQVEFGIYPDSNFSAGNGYISTITPNQTKALWGDKVSDYEANRIAYGNATGKYANERGELVNPVFWQNSIIYNPKYANNDAIALDALHVMHDDPIYEELFTDYMNEALNNEALVDAAGDEFGDRGRYIFDKYRAGIPLSLEEQEAIIPAFDAFLRRQFAPSYMVTGKRGGYQNPLKLDGELNERVNAIRRYLESIPLPEVIVNK